MKKKIIFSFTILLAIITGLIITSNKDKNYFKIEGYPNLKIMVSNNGEIVDAFPTKDNNLYYNVITTCDNADTYWDYDNWEMVVSNLTKTSKCKVSFTSNTKSKAYDKIISLWNNTDGTNNIFKETHTFDDNTTYTEYRYEGTDTEVNNYVWFNNELWRIIGAFPGGTPTTSDTSLGNRAPSTNNTVKIIRNDVIGSFAWDKDNTNNWTTAELNTNILNNLYLNSTSGTCNFNSTYVTKPCSFTKNGLKNVLDYIETATWNLGGSTDSNAETMYKNERGTTVKTSGTPIVTTAKVGLMYVSDYGYSVKNSSCNHSSISLGSYNKTACGGSAWVLKNGDEWTVSPNYSSASSVFGVNVDANVFSNSGADRGFGARPVLYLKPNVYITGGDGSINNPFQVGL